MSEYLFFASILVFIMGIFMMLLRQPLYKRRGKFLFLIGIVMLLVSIYFGWDNIKIGFNTVNSKTPAPADTVSPA